MRPGAKGFTTDVCVPISRLTECILQSQAEVRGCALAASLPALGGALPGPRLAGQQEPAWGLQALVVLGAGLQGSRGGILPP